MGAATRPHSGLSCTGPAPRGADPAMAGSKPVAAQPARAYALLEALLDGQRTRPVEKAALMEAGVARERSSRKAT